MNGSTEIVKATISPEYRWRVGLFAVFCLFWTGWCFWDGLVNYPAQREHAQAFLDAKEKGLEWQPIATEHGWDPNEDPGRPKSDFDIMTQFIMAGITAPLALIWTVGFIRAGGRWVELRPDGLATSKGQHVPFDTISVIDKQRWKSKGIAVVKYQDPKGRTKTVVLDDWKYTRLPTIEIVRAVESHLTKDQIVGGPPEPPSDIPSPMDAQEQAVVDQETDPTATQDPKAKPQPWEPSSN